MDGDNRESKDKFNDQRTGYQTFSSQTTGFPNTSQSYTAPDYSSLTNPPYNPNLGPPYPGDDFQPAEYPPPPNYSQATSPPPPSNYPPQSNYPNQPGYPGPPPNYPGYQGPNVVAPPIVHQGEQSPLRPQVVESSQQVLVNPGYSTIFVTNYVRRPWLFGVFIVIFIVPAIIAAIIFFTAAAR